MHNDVRTKGKGRSVPQPCKRFIFENFPTVVSLLFLAYVYKHLYGDKHMYGDFTKDEKEYQDTIHGKDMVTDLV